MGYQRSLRALAAHWTETAGLLSADTLRYIVVLITRIGQDSGTAAMETAEELGWVLDQVLPPGGNPVRQALEAPETRGNQGSSSFADWAGLASQILAEAGDIDLIASSAPTPDEVTFWTSRWLLAEAALTENELRARGQDPADPSLIRLDRDDGGEQWPSFQFGPDGTARAVVQTVNLLLGAEEDPWGVADWWLGHNQWLRAIPARLIGRIDDELVIAAARSADPEA